MIVSLYEVCLISVDGFLSGLLLELEVQLESAFTFLDEIKADTFRSGDFSLGGHA